MNKSLSALAAIMSAVICTVAPASLGFAQAHQGSVVRDKPMIEIQAHAQSKSEGLVVLEILVKNSGTVPAYVVIDPRRVDRSKGPYIDTDGADPSTLICSFQLYQPNPFHPFVDGTSVRLLRLEPGTSHVDVVRLSLPLRTTEPPFSSAPGARDVPAVSVKRIEVRVGVLPALAALKELVTRKRIPHDAFTGMERIEIGSTLKSLYDIQEIVRSNSVEIRFDEPHTEAR
jgi:hypothetical protein